MVNKLIAEEETVKDVMKPKRSRPKKIFTENQLAFREALLKSNKRIGKRNVTPAEKGIPKDEMVFKDFMSNKANYLRNCLFWINEYQEARTDIVGLSSTVESIKNHALDMQQKIKQYTDYIKSKK